MGAFKDARKEVLWRKKMEVGTGHSSWVTVAESGIFMETLFTLKSASGPSTVSSEKGYFIVYYIPYLFITSCKMLIPYSWRRCRHTWYNMCDKIYNIFSSLTYWVYKICKNIYCVQYFSRITRGILGITYVFFLLLFLGRCPYTGYIKYSYYSCVARRIAYVKK